MTKTSKILLFAVGALAWWYVPTILALRNIKLSLVSFFPVGINDSKITASIGVKLQNFSNTRVDIAGIGADVLFNGVKIAEFYNTRFFTLLGKSQQTFDVIFTIDAETVGNELWSMLVNNNLQNSVLQVVGSINANDKTLPFETFFTINDITH